MEIVFINQALTKAIDDYLKSNDNPQGVVYNSFLVVVIRLLISIYSELDIVNPKLIDNPELFRENLAKYNYPVGRIEAFINELQAYYDLELANENKQIKIRNDYFIRIQKDLIDMLISKKLNYHLTNEETIAFYDLLYTPYSKNPLRVSYNFLMADDVCEIDNYFKRQMQENVKKVVPSEKHYLNVKAYELLNYSFDDIKSLDGKEIDKINTQVYDYFKIRENAINKEYLLEKAIEAIERENNKVTSGNGYVDILLVISVIATVIMLVTIVTFVIL